MDPQQEIFTSLKLALEALGYDVYDEGLPPADTPYPFIYLADSRMRDDENKTAVFGTVYQRIHVWSNNPKKRGTLSKILLDIKTTCRKLEHTANFAWSVRGIDQSISHDNTTKTPLLHGVLDVTFKFS